MYKSTNWYAGPLWDVQQEVTNEATLINFISELREELVKFIGHLFRDSWQQEQLKRCKENMAPKSAVVIIDYAENDSRTSQDEVQSAHWSNTQVTIHPVMAFINATDSHGTFSNNEAIILFSER